MISDWVATTRRGCSRCPRSFFQKPGSTESLCVVCRAAQEQVRATGTTDYHRVVAAMESLGLATAAEVAAVSGVALKSVSAYLTKLKQEGRIEVSGEVPTKARGKKPCVYRAVSRSAA